MDKIWNSMYKVLANVVGFGFFAFEIFINSDVLVLNFYYFQVGGIDITVYVYNIVGSILTES